MNRLERMWDSDIVWSFRHSPVAIVATHCGADHHHGGGFGALGSRRITRLIPPR
jgi:hypothetical protein